MSLRSDAGDPEFQKARVLAEKRAARSLELARQGVPPEGPLAMLASDPETRGPELFDKHCVVCHKLNDHVPAEAKVGAPDLSGFGTEKWVLKLLDNPDSVELFGKTPFNGMMPSVTRPPKDPEAATYFTKMKDEDMKAIAAFLVTEASGKSKKGMPGEKLVRERCTSCHRLDGKTDDAESLAPELRGWASVRWIEEQIKNPGGGKTYPAGAMAKDLEGHMPAFQDELNPAEITLLARWVYREATGQPPP
jgi:ubiquinol-cytochrome c reductase cytochrome b subunit